MVAKTTAFHNKREVSMRVRVSELIAAGGKGDSKGGDKGNSSSSSSSSDSKRGDKGNSTGGSYHNNGFLAMVPSTFHPGRPGGKYGGGREDGDGGGEGGEGAVGNIPFWVRKLCTYNIF